MNENTFEDQPIAWTPSPEVIERAQLTKFMRQVGVSTFDELYQYSIRDVEKFTDEVLKFLDIKFDPPYTKLLDTSNGPEFPTWFATGNSHESGDAGSESEPGAVATGFPTAGLNITEASQRMAQAEVEEELIRRFPEVAPAVEAWSADLTNDEDLFTVILANINEMPVAA